MQDLKGSLGRARGGLQSKKCGAAAATQEGFQYLAENAQRALGQVRCASKRPAQRTRDGGLQHHGGGSGYLYIGWATKPL